MSKITRHIGDTDIQQIIDEGFENRAEVTASTRGALREAVEHALAMLDAGEARVAEPVADGTPNGGWQVNQWLKKAVLLSFRLNDMDIITGGPAGRRGGTRCPPSSRAGTAPTSRRPASGPCPAPSCAIPPSSPRTWC